MEVLIKSLAGLVGVIISALIGFYVGMRKVRMEYRGNIGMEVWKTRKEVYSELLKHMGAIPKWPNRIGKTTYQDLLTLSEQFKDWYFKQGGLFLTNRSKDKYFVVQETIEKILKDTNELDNKIDKDLYKQIRANLSSLRTEMTNDLLSRQRDLLSKYDEGNIKKEGGET